MGVLVVLSLAAIPLGILVSFVRDRSLRRRSRFRSRSAGLAICMIVPWMVEVPSAVSEQGSLTPVFLGLGWGLLLAALAPRLLFLGTAVDPGSSDDSGPGPGPESDPQPPRPIGGIPLPDADQLAKRVRGPHTPRHVAQPRRPAREPERRPRAPSQTHA
jgi:hypothetical protein